MDCSTCTISVSRAAHRRFFELELELALALQLTPALEPARQQDLEHSVLHSVPIYLSVGAPTIEA